MNSGTEKPEMVTPGAVMTENPEETTTEETVVAEQKMVAETYDESVEKLPLEEHSDFQQGIVLTPGKLAVVIAVFVLLIAALIGLIISSAAKEKKEMLVVDEPEKTVAETVEATIPPAETVEATIPPDGNPDDVTCKGSYSASAEELTANASNVVAKVGDYVLTNEQLQVFYWMEVRNFLQNYGAYATYFGLDYTQPLDTQICGITDSGITWQQYFLDFAMESWQNYQAMAAKAESENFVITDESRALLDGMEDDLKKSAEENGYASLEEMLTASMGTGATYAAYAHFSELYFAGFDYYGKLSEDVNPTDEEIDRYFEENKESYADSGLTKDTVNVDVRHILVCPETAEGENGEETISEEAWAACEVKAQEILDRYMSGEQTEENFAALATELTEDPGSKETGGLYEDVSEGMMVAAFNDWCFDKERQPADTGIVKTEYGYHVMYFVNSKLQWQSAAASDLKNATLTKMVESISNEYPMTIDYSKIYLGVVEFN